MLRFVIFPFYITSRYSARRGPNFPLYRTESIKTRDTAYSAIELLYAG